MAAIALRFGRKPSPPPAGIREEAPPRPVPPIREDVEDSIAEGIELDDIEGLDARALVQRMLRLSLAFFAAEVIRGDVASQAANEDPDNLMAPARGQTVIADHHQEWDEIVRKFKQFCIIAPRDHGKSHIFTIALPIWEAWRRPNVEIVIFSETQPQAERQLEKLKLEIDNNPRLFHLKDPSCWSAKKVRLTNGSTILACGFGTRSRGMHPHLIICDDVVSEAAMYSELIRERQANYFLAAVRNMLVPGGTIAVIGTPQHADDLYGSLERNPEWFFKRYQAIDKDGVLLFPERYNRARLEARRREIGEIRFQREFLGLPVGSGMSLFPDELVTGEPFLQFTATIGAYLPSGELARKWWVDRGVERFYAGVDIATSSNIKADWFVIFVIGLDHQGNRWVVDIFREQGLGYKAQKAAIVEKCKIWRVEYCCIESNAAQKIYGAEIREDTDIPVLLHQTGAEKHSLEKGIPSLRLLFENRKYRVPRGDDASIEISTIWIGEMQSWTFTKEKGVISVARYDDTAMAQWMCEHAIARGESFSFAFDEQPGDADAADELGFGPVTPGLDIPLEDDPWITMGLEPADMAPMQGRRGNLDYGGAARPPQDPKTEAPQGRPVHPLGPAIPLWDLVSAKKGTLN